MKNEKFLTNFEAQDTFECEKNTHLSCISISCKSHWFDIFKTFCSAVAILYHFSETPGMHTLYIRLCLYSWKELIWLWGVLCLLMKIVLLIKYIYYSFCEFSMLIWSFIWLWQKLPNALIASMPYCRFH